MRLVYEITEVNAQGTEQSHRERFPDSNASQHTNHTTVYLHVCIKFYVIMDHSEVERLVRTCHNRCAFRLLKK